MQHEIDRRLLLGGAGALGVAATSALAQEAKPVTPAVKADEKPAGSGRRLSDIIADFVVGFDIAKVPPLGIERARLARLLHRLEARGLIQRLPSANDGRRHALQLTPTGRSLLARAKTLAAKHERRLIERLGAARHDLLLTALRDI